jgi:hypothetical protein
MLPKLGAVTGIQTRADRFAGSPGRPPRDDHRSSKPAISVASNFDVYRIEQTCLEILNQYQLLHIRRQSIMLVAEIDQNPVKTERSCQDFSMQNYIESQNIAIFKQRLGTETDAAKQEILRQLLADEIAKCAARIEAKLDRGL